MRRTHVCIRFVSFYGQTGACAERACGSPSDEVMSGATPGCEHDG